MTVHIKLRPWIWTGCEAGLRPLMGNVIRLHGTASNAPTVPITDFPREIKALLLPWWLGPRSPIHKAMVQWELGLRTTYFTSFMILVGPSFGYVDNLLYEMATRRLTRVVIDNGTNCPFNR